jgi:aminoglycoside phosphotransferase (APT) family kinase protein
MALVPNPTADTLRASLQGLAVVPDWLAAPRQPDRVRSALLSGVPELASGEILLAGVVAEQLRAKGSRWLAQYQLTISAAGGADPRQVVLVGELLAPTALVAPDECRVHFGERGWHGFLPDLRLRLLVRDADEGLPILPQLVDPNFARILLQRCLHEGGYTQAQVAECSPKVVRYDAGTRCTIVYRVSYLGAPDGLPDPVVFKTHLGDKGRAAYEAMRALWDTPLSSGEVVTLAEPLAYLPELRILAQGPVQEDRTLKALARDALVESTRAAIAELRTELLKTADGLAALHRCGVQCGPTFAWREELDGVQEVVTRLAMTIPTVTAAANPLMAYLASLANQAPADQAVTTHGTFRPAQVLLHDGKIGFIDFDGSCMAEPAFDIGRFRATLRDIGISTPAHAGKLLRGQALTDRLAILDELCEEFLDRYRQQAPVTRDRVLLWEATDLLALLLHAWSKVRLARVQPRLSLLNHYLGTLLLPAATSVPESAYLPRGPRAVGGE